MKSYKEVKINRLWHGFASVRDYQRDEAINKGQDLKIVLGKEYVVVPLDELSKGFKNDDVFLSKHDNKKYSLVDYDWKTYKPRKEPEQLSFGLLDSLANYQNYGH